MSIYIFIQLDYSQSKIERFVSDNVVFHCLLSIMTPLLNITHLSKSYGNLKACNNINFNLYPGQVLGIIGESGSGKSTLLNSVGGNLSINEGKITYTNSNNKTLNIKKLSDAQHRKLTKTEWGFVQQNPRDGLRMNVTAGANIAERLLNVGVRHYGNIRSESNRFCNGGGEYLT